MKLPRSILQRAVAISPVLILISGPAAQACSVCFGDPDSGLVKGAKAGVIVLAGIVYSLLFMMTAVAGTWILRARRLAAESETDPSNPT